MNKKQLQLQLNRFYMTDSPCAEISNIIGIDKLDFINYIEKYFQPDMNRVNFGRVWQLDHIVPVPLFNLRTESELCYNYLNIIPMYNQDNKFKGASVHFSLELLQNRLKYYPNNPIIIQLIDKCKHEIDTKWKYYK